MAPAAVCAGKNILVTGAGGYIGSALVKAVAASDPRSLTLLDTSEHGMFQLKRLLDRDFALVRYQVVVGSVTDSALVDALFRESQTHVVFHAAAFKHVELMELNPLAALTNNVLGTSTVAQAAAAHGCESFVLLSTDKAVRPHSVMGVSKRIAELITVSLSRPHTRMNVVRLGNITGSPGSVVPLFKEQIAQGRPITITDPEATRYFMTLEEAVMALVEAAACRLDGCILLPPFRPPVRIIDLAQSLANVGGSYPIQIDGLKPGEKVSEDFVGADETEIADAQGSLAVFQTPKLRSGECEDLAERLRTYTARRTFPEILELLRSLVPEYVPSKLMLSRAQVPAKV